MTVQRKTAFRNLIFKAHHIQSIQRFVELWVYTLQPDVDTVYRLSSLSHL